MKLKTRLTRLAAIIAAEADRNPEFAAKLGELLGDSPRSPGTSQKKRKVAVASGEGVSGHRGRRAPAMVDPVALARESEALLREKLSELDHERLLDVVAEYGFDPGKLVMKWKDDARIADRIVELALARATKGDAFRNE